jgi:hypothetical protein
MSGNLAKLLIAYGILRTFGKDIHVMFLVILLELHDLYLCYLINFW